VRYGLMLRETGTIFDDGTVVALAPDRLLITTTSGNAARVYQWLEEWQQCEWPDLRVAIAPVTEQWATLSLAGPLARKILSRLDTDIDLSREAFPHLTLREGTLLGLPARIYRVSFTGELTYEINVPSDSATKLWEALLAVGASDGLTPFGMDALMTLRLEKGFLHVGTDTDGTTVPQDIGWGKVASAKGQDFIGRRSLTLPENLKSDRLQLVGLKAVATQVGRKHDVRAADSTTRTELTDLGVRALYTPALSFGALDRVVPFAVGSHLRLKGSKEVTDGWITSAGLTVFGHVPIALALLRGGRERVGTEVMVFDGGRAVGHAQVIEAPFYNATAERMLA
jgi:sarcosine oxidase, subunit alpha